VGNDHDDVVQHAHGYESVFSIVETVIIERQHEPSKNGFGVSEIDSVLFEICGSLSVIPSQLHN
jgi:hypothetical protein